MDLQPLLLWVESGPRPPWDQVAGSSTATKGLWAKFEALRVRDGVLQRAWKEERWQVVVPRALREAVLKTSHGTTSPPSPRVLLGAIKKGCRGLLSVL